MLLGEDGAWFTNSASVVKVKIANISSFSLLPMKWESKKKAFLKCQLEHVGLGGFVSFDFFHGSIKPFG